MDITNLTAAEIEAIKRVFANNRMGATGKAVELGIRRNVTRKLEKMGLIVFIAGKEPHTYLLSDHGRYHGLDGNSAGRGREMNIDELITHLASASTMLAELKQAGKRDAEFVADQCSLIAEELEHVLAAVVARGNQAAFAAEAEAKMGDRTP